MASTDIFQKALEFTLKWEGYKSDDPSDLGKRTIFGIASKFYSEEVEAMWDLPKEDAVRIAARIYLTHYWLAGSCYDLPDKTAIVHFDNSVNCGLHQTVIWLQESIGVMEDGVIGPITLKYVDNYVKINSDLTLANEILQRRGQFYHFLAENNPKVSKWMVKSG